MPSDPSGSGVPAGEGRAGRGETAAGDVFGGAGCGAAEAAAGDKGGGPRGERRGRLRERLPQLFFLLRRGGASRPLLALVAGGIMTEGAGGKEQHQF